MVITLLFAVLVAFKREGGFRADAYVGGNGK